MQEPVLVSFAMLNVKWESDQRSYIHNFVPFAAECMRLSPTAELSAVDIQRQLEENYGFRLPTNVVEGILRRATRDGLAQRAHGVFVRNDDALAGQDLTAVRSMFSASTKPSLIDSSGTHGRFLIGHLSALRRRRPSSTTSLAGHCRSCGRPSLAKASSPNWLISKALNMSSPVSLRTCSTVILPPLPSSKLS